MVGFFEDQWGVYSEPLAGVVLVLFDSRDKAECELLKQGLFMRVFYLQCRTGHCELEFMGSHTKLLPGEACVVCSCSDDANRCSLHRSGDFTGSLVGLVRREVPEPTRQALRAFDVDISTFERLFEKGNIVRSLQVSVELDHAYALLYALPERPTKGIVRLRSIELAYALSRVSWKTGGSAPKAHKPTHEDIARRAQEVLTRDFSQPLTIPATAKLCGTSSTVLKQSFRETYGESVHEWYRARRMREAANLLENTSYSVAQISSEVGYSNPSKFSKVFFQHMGSTPSAWRATHRV